MLSMGFPFYLFVAALPVLIVAAILQIIVTSQKNCVDKPEAQEEEGGQDETENPTEDEFAEDKRFAEKTESFRNSMLCNFFIMFFYEATLEISISLIIGW
jgi:hypothetical protein